MRVLRNKNFASPSQVNQPQQSNPENEPLTSKDLLLEQMKQQRQLMITQRMRQKLQAQEARDQMKLIQNLQKADREEKRDEDNNNIKVKRLENQDNSSQAKNVSLYKTRSKLVAPVPMKN